MLNKQSNREPVTVVNGKLTLPQLELALAVPNGITCPYLSELWK